MSMSDLNFANSIAVWYSMFFHDRCATSLRSLVPGVTHARLSSGQKQVRLLNDLTGFRMTSSLGAHVPSRLEVVRVGHKGFCRHYVLLLQHKNCWATSDGMTLACNFTLAV